MSIPAMKQIMREIKDAAEAAAKRMEDNLPPLFKKHHKRLDETMESFRTADVDAARRANLDARGRGKKEPYDLKDPKSVKGARNQELREQIGNDIIDNLLTGKPVNPVKDSELARIYAAALKDEYKKAFVGAVLADQLYDAFVEGTPAEEAISRDDFSSAVDTAYGIAESGHGAVKDAHSLRTEGTMGGGIFDAGGPGGRDIGQ